jgi:spermidine synthase
MEAWTELARACTAGGDELVLRGGGGGFEIRCNGWELMSTRAHHSEEELARLAAAALAALPAPRLLLGGLGLGYTLRALLAALPAAAQVVVAELFAEVIAWNRGPLAHVAGVPLEDGRVALHCGDVAGLLEAAAAAYDGILLDVDNGPEAVMLPGNALLYTAAGLALIRRALAAGGVLGVWSAEGAMVFVTDREAALGEEVARGIAARGGRADPRHALYFARPGAGAR